MPSSPTPVTSRMLPWPADDDDSKVAATTWPVTSATSRYSTSVLGQAIPTILRKPSESSDPSVVRRSRRFWEDRHNRLTTEVKSVGPGPGGPKRGEIAEQHIIESRS